MEIIKLWTELRVIRHSNKDFMTWWLSQEGILHAQQVWEGHFSSSNILSIISSSSARVKDTLDIINNAAYSPHQWIIQEKEYLWLWWFTQEVIDEFVLREHNYKSDESYVQNVLLQINTEHSKENNNGVLEIIQDQVVQDYIDGKFEIADCAVAWRMIKKLHQMMVIYEWWKWFYDSQSGLILAGTHGVINGSVFRAIRWNNLPEMRKSPVRYAEWMSYQPITTQDNGIQSTMLKIAFRGHEEYVHRDTLKLIRNT